MPDLAELFAEQQTNKVVWDGQEAFALHEFERLPSRLRVEFLRASDDEPVQGINLRIRGGSLVVNDVEAPNLLLWHDTAPGVVEVVIRPKGGRKPSLKVWNVWRERWAGGDVTQAWLGNAGMRVDEEDAGVVLRCSDGAGPVDFNDLVVRLTPEE